MFYLIELVKENMHINSVHPGFVKTSMISEMGHADEFEKK